MTTQSEFIVIERIDQVLRLTLDRPQKKNAMTPCMYWTLVDALRQAEKDESVHAVMIANNGDFFCAGNDVGSFASLSEIPYRERPGFTFMNTLATFGKPLVAAVCGSAVGLGVTMLLHCDLVCASENTRLGFPFVTIGLVPEFGSTALLPQRLGHQKAAEILLLGRKISATEALELGLINTITTNDALQAQAMEYARSLSMQPAAAVMETRRLMKRAAPESITQRIDEETQAINRLLPTLKLPQRA